MISEFLEFCKRNYNRDAECFDCKNNCPQTGDCEKCLDLVHFGNGDRKYNCINILNYYACKYLHKYSSEIGYVFNLNELSDLKEYNVLSIGCGPCTDFFGISDLIETKKHNVQLNYLGIELNEDWGFAHNWIKANSQHNYKITYMDAYVLLKKPEKYLGEFRPNVIIINYLISDLLKAGCDVLEFMNLLETNLFRTLSTSTYIIINDYNRGLSANDPRTYYDQFETIISSNSKVRIAKCHFKHNIKRYHPYHYQHPQNEILFPLMPIIHNFHPWNFCSSAQLLIKKV